MSVLVYAEHAGGKFKKSTLEILSYGNEIAKQTGTELLAISIGEVPQSELALLAKYGASKILNVPAAKLKTFVNQAYASVVAQVAISEKASLILLSNSFTGKGLAPRIAVKLKAGLVHGAVAIPDLSNGFTVRKTAYSGKAFADVTLTSENKVITLVPNAYKLVEDAKPENIVEFEANIKDSDFAAMVKEIVRAADKVSLPEAELVVSAGRGLKGPENWGMIEELAGLLGAATACSKPFLILTGDLILSMLARLEFP